MRASKPRWREWMERADEKRAKEGAQKHGRVRAHVLDQQKGSNGIRERANCDRVERLGACRWQRRLDHDR